MCDKSRNTWLCVDWQWNTLEWCQLNALQASPVVHLVTPLSCVSLSMNTQPSVPAIQPYMYDSGYVPLAVLELFIISMSYDIDLENTLWTTTICPIYSLVPAMYDSFTRHILLSLAHISNMPLSSRMFIYRERRSLCIVNALMHFWDCRL